MAVVVPSAYPPRRKNDFVKILWLPRRFRKGRGGFAALGYRTAFSLTATFAFFPSKNPSSS